MSRYGFKTYPEEILENSCVILPFQKKEPGLYHIDSRIFVFSQDRAATLKLFNHTLIQKHARVASIERMKSRFEQPSFGFYGYNFFDMSSGLEPVILNRVWHFKDTVKTLDSLYTDLSSFRRRHLARSSMVQILL